MKSFKHYKLVAFLVIFTLVSSLAACGGKTTTEDAAAKSDTVAQSTDTKQEEQKAEIVDPLGKYEQPIEITTIKSIDPTMKYMEGESYDNNVWIKGYESELGIKVKFLWAVNYDQYKQKLNVSLASGDMPDIIPCYADQYGTLLKSGIAMPLDDVYAKWASPTTKSILEEDGGIQLSSAKYKGQLTALPWTESAFLGSFVTWIRSDWLKNLGLSEPKTIDDLDKIAIAFTKDDPDKNGKNDTYGISMDKNFIEDGFCSVTGYFNANNAYPKIWIKDSSGKLAYGSIQPEAKATLAKLQNLYKQGIINKEFAIKDAGKASEDLVSGKAGMMWGMFWNAVFPLQGSKDKNPSSEWKAYVLPSGAKSQLNLPVPQYYVVNKNSKNPEALVKMLNMWDSKKFDAGVAKEEYEKYIATTDPAKADFQPYKYALFIANRSADSLENYNELQKALKDKDPSKLTRSSGNIENYENIQKYLNGDMKQWAMFAVFAEGGSNYVVSELIKNKTYIMNEFYGAPTATMTEKWTTLKKMEDEAYTKIIMGAASVDEFDKFVDNWKKLGGEAVTQEVNDWYASKQ